MIPLHYGMGRGGSLIQKSEEPEWYLVAFAYVALVECVEVFGLALEFVGMFSYAEHMLRINQICILI